jgi:hypothetical protein
MVSVMIGIVVVALAAAGGGVALRRSRRMPKPRAIDSFTLSEPWRRHVAAAQATQRRYREITRSTQEGPLRDRLEGIDRQVQHAVEECFDIAKRGDDLDDALGRLDNASLQAQLARATDPAATASLQSQLDSAARIRATRDDTDDRLRLLTTRMGELVAQAAEVAVGTDTTEQLGSGVDEVVLQLQALRAAVSDVNNTGRRST